MFVNGHRMVVMSSTCMEYVAWESFVNLSFEVSVVSGRLLMQWSCMNYYKNTQFCLQNIVRKR
jgi:hypothetical protein